MKTQTSLGSLEIPDAWVDQSLFRYVGQTPAVEGLPIGPEVPASTVVLHETQAEDGPAQLVANLEQLYLRQFRGVAIESHDGWNHPEYGAAPALTFSHEVGPGQSVRQTVVCLPKESIKVLLFTFTAPVRAYETVLPEFKKAFDSYRKSSSP